MIREAKTTDAKDISKLVADNHIKNQTNKEKGFLRYKRSSKQIKKIIDKSLIALVYVKNSQIIGFMNTHPQKKPEKKKIKWLNKQAKKIYYNSKKSATIYLGVIAPKYLHQGIGTKLFNQMVVQLQHQGYENLFASATTKPIPNKASLSFIKNKDFQKVPTTKIKKKPKIETAIFMRKI